MSMRSRVVCLFAFVGSVVQVALPHASAQDQEPVPVLDARVQDFFNRLKDSSTTQKAALDRFVAGGPLAQNENLERLVEKVRGFNQKYGTYLASEQVHVNVVGKSKDLVLMKYLYKATSFPVVWHFAFYRRPTTSTETPNDWVVVSVRGKPRTLPISPSPAATVPR